MGWRGRNRALPVVPSIKIMGKNLTGKAAFIVGVLLVFVFGFIGIPKGGLKQSILNRIHLGLDLKGGTHLVLQVHVDEAVTSSTDRDVVRLQTDLQKVGITGATVGKTDPANPETIVVTGIPPDEAERRAGSGWGQRLQHL